MNGQSQYHGYRFPPTFISHTVWPCHRFTLSFRYIEDLLAQRNIGITNESIRQWCRKFGPTYAKQLRLHQGQLGDTWHLDEIFTTAQEKRHYLWRTVDQDDNVVDILVQKRQEKKANERFFRKMLKRRGRYPK